jgi:flagellar biosynthesis/type III secretory pathway chaperone
MVPLKNKPSLTDNKKGKWMMKLFSGLLSILEEQTSCYERIYELKVQEQRLVVSGRPEEIQANTSEIERVTEMIRSLEGARLEIMDSVAQQFDLPHSHIDMARLMELADGKDAEGLQRITDRLVDVLRRTSRINQDNAFLVRRSLDVIDRSLEIVMSAGTQSDNYGGDGRRQKASGATMTLDRQA